VKRSLAALMMALVAAMACPPSIAPAATTVTVNPAPTGRVEVYAGQNPDTNETNLQPRYQRLAQGTYLRDLMGTLATSGAWSNLAIKPANGLNVTINPSPNGAQLGAIYQFGQDDTTVLPPSPGQSPNQLPSDSTKIVIQATQAAATGNLGPLNPPSGAGKAVYYLVEAQISPVDNSNQSMLFVSSSGITSYQNINTTRQDIITYQYNSNGGSATADCSTTFPPAPTPDNGWVPIGLVCVPNGATQITNPEIAMYSGTNFNGLSFSQVTFGGNYSQNNPSTAAPSVLTTNSFPTCGFSAASGFVINNVLATSNGNHLIAGDIAGDVTVCGNNLGIFAANGVNPATFTVNTSTDSGGSTNEVMYPAHSPTWVYETTAGSCANGTTCAITTNKFICFNAGSVSTAIVTPTLAFQGLLPELAADPSTPNGVSVLFFNETGSSIPGSTQLKFYYTCF
jgi:hypothetical protein